MRKRFLALALACGMLAGTLAGCGSGGASTGAAGDASDTSKDAAAEEESSGSPTLDAILKKGKITVGIGLAGIPIGYYDDSGEAMGYDVDFAYKLGEVLGVEVEIVEVNAETRTPALTSGRCDILIANVTGNLERAKSIDFSIPYLRCGIKMLTAAGSDLHVIEDLNRPEITVSVNRGSTGEELVNTYAPNANVLYTDDFTGSILQVEQGKADAAFEDNTVVDYAAATNDKLEAQEKMYTSDPICIACRKGDIEFLRYLDMFVSWQISSGWQAETYEKWWGVQPEQLEYFW